MIKVYQTIECKNNVITTITFKGVKVKVEFKGGNMMKGIPARLYTRDPFVQKALDESDQKGRMYRFVQELPEGNESKKEAAASQQPTRQPATEQPGADAPGTGAEPENPGADAPGTGAEPENPAADAAGTAAEPNSEEAQDGGKTADHGLEFDNLAEAITYIAATWGEQVESESQARKFIEEKTGMKPVIHKG